MGRHSRRAPDGTDTPQTGDLTGPHAAPGPAPWTGGTAPPGPAGAQHAAAAAQPPEWPGAGRRRRRGEDGPAVRGGHPQHGEGPAVPGAPQPPQAPGVPLVPHQRGTGATRPGVLGTPVDPGGARPGPRQEYLDAFADDDVFAAGAPGTGPAPGAPSAPPGAPRPPKDPRSAAQQGAVPAPPPPRGPEEDAELAAYEAEFGEPGPLPDGPADTAGRRRGTKGRTFTGVAAAAVTTVLAVVVAGQVADARKQGAEGTPVSGGDAAPEADATDSGATAAPATYAARMAKVYPLAADLKGPGTFKPVGGAAAAPGRGHVVRYRVDIEDGLGLDGGLFAEAVHKTLNDDRSWAHGGRRTFERVASGRADFVITLASPGTTDAWCAKSGLDTSEERVSCDSAATERVMINAYRWARGAATYGPDRMYAYRQMLINHEVGHRLGHDHEGCHRQGALAPVMMQQTKFLTTDGVTCRPNAWPFPKG
ncbi:DUF3152 domain-containing protein [Streptomyces sp. Ru73]|uniref:DUF3152 domain-containing protein n=1 Tax=Streptomyces sp. Ru73 TaxID=2080748 RepID=UPI0021564156|nr:DUF3152 domain-containing protein [Streptomyces sp. Ru73]